MHSSISAHLRSRLVVTARRARALGIEANGPCALKLADGIDAAAIYSLVADADPDEEPNVDGPRASARRAIELAKIAHRLPALLVADIDSPTAR
jgi:hypothetical protein